MTIAADLAIPGVYGQRTPTVRAANSYVSRVLAAAADDTTVGTALVRVSVLVDPPIALLQPRVALRVLRRRPVHRGPKVSDWSCPMARWATGTGRSLRDRE